ncbi:MAG TPA: hypothetical protein VLG28_00060 [Acidimicrobiia bacterium]|jgi:hypothetical protein|nr:hypothetical protein [Acidimicrobiia bacterium]
MPEERNQQRDKPQPARDRTGQRSGQPQQRGRRGPLRTRSPAVVLDVVFEEGLLFFELQNRDSVPVTNVVTSFNRSVQAPDGATDLTQLRIFQKVSFLASGKILRVFVDSAAGYFARRQPNTLRVELSWNRGGINMTTIVSHDLRIYRDLPFVVGRGEAARRGVALTDQTNQRRR